MTTKPVTTRRIIRPGGSVESVVSAPSPALQPRTPPPSSAPQHALWRSWLARFEAADRAAVAADLKERQTWLHAPRQADPAEAKRVRSAYLDPWSGVIEVFSAAVAVSPLGEAQQQALRSYLELRADWYRAVMKRYLVPSEQSMIKLAETATKLDAAVAARQAGRPA